MRGVIHSPPERSTGAEAWLWVTLWSRIVLHEKKQSSSQDAMAPPSSGTYWRVFVKAP